jgi:hypothetical protein
MNSQALRNALADFKGADRDDFESVPLEEVAHDLARAVETHLAAEEQQATHDTTSGVWYVPVVNDGMVGYRCQHPDGRETFIYFNPSDSSDDGTPNVFVYEGPHFDPAKDAPSHHYDIDWKVG